MSELHLGGRRVALVRVLIWAAILAAALLFWIGVGVALISWMS